MNQLNKNRLIGGGVIAFAALLFAPAILTPETNQLSNPDLAVSINPSSTTSQESVARLEQKNNQNQQNLSPSVPFPAPPTLALESTTNVAAANTPKPVKNPVKSQPKATAKTVPVALKTKPVKPKKANSQARSSWLRVGSFASVKNANSLLKKLQSRYPAKVEKITINGKTYHRVLVGPYNDEGALQQAKKIFSSNGYKPSIQR